MNYMRQILVLVFMTMSAACGVNTSDSKDDKAAEFRMVVNDSVIAIGDVNKITFPLMWYFDIYHGEKAMDESRERFKFTKNQVMLYAVEQYMAAVGAGGHYQYFADPGGILWGDARAGLKEIGLNEYYQVLDTAIHKLGGLLPGEVVERNKLLDSIDVGFSKEDSIFFELKKKLSGEDKMMQFVKAHSKDFYFDRMVKKPK